MSMKQAVIQMQRAAEKLVRQLGCKADDSEGRWVTTSQGNRLFIGEDGEARTGPGGNRIPSAEDTKLLDWMGPPEEFSDFGMLKDRLTKEEQSVPESVALDAWISNPSGKVAQELNKVAQSMAGDDSIKTSKEAKELFLRLHREARKSGLPKRMELYRGLRKDMAGRKKTTGELVSHTEDASVAREFAGSGGRVVKETVQRADLVSWHGSKYWPSQSRHEKEYISMQRNN